MKHVFVSVVIPAYNEDTVIDMCLDSFVLQKTKHKFEVIIVDNNSTDNTYNLVKSYENKLNLKVIKEEQKGRGVARNTGFAHATGDIILSTDADAIVPPHWIETLASYMEEKEGVYVAVTGSHIINDCSRFNNFLLNAFSPFLMDLHSIFFGHQWLSGYNFAVWKDVYVKTGGFRTDLNALEDIDIGFKINKLGKIKFLRSLNVISSGRRFKRGVFRVLFPRIYEVFACYLDRKRKFYLTDIR